MISALICRMMERREWMDRWVSKVSREDGRIGFTVVPVTYLIQGGLLGQLDGQVHHGHVRRGHTESHAGELAIQLGNDLTHRLGRSRGGRDDVVARATPGAPVLAALGGTIHRELVGRHGVHRGHQALDDAEVVVDHLG